MTTFFLILSICLGMANIVNFALGFALLRKIDRITDQKSAYIHSTVSLAEPKSITFTSSKRKPIVMDDAKALQLEKEDRERRKPNIF